MTRTRRRQTALVCAVAFSSGCFTYVPTNLSAIPDRAHVRVHLTPAGQIATTQRVGRRVEETMDGTLTGRQANQLLLRVPIAAQQQGFFRSDMAQSVQIPEPDVAGLEVRTFSRGRTGLLVAGSAAGAAAIVLTIMSGSGGGTTLDPDPTPDIRLPLLRFPAP